MLYHLFDWLTKNGIKFPGSGLFQFITFRVLLAVILSLVIATVFGKKIINLLIKKQIGESLQWILLEDIGKPLVRQDISISIVKKTLKEFLGR